MEIEISGVSFSYPGVNVLHDVNIRFDEPKLYGILGPNGVGKSTLIHCINRILESTEGVVTVDEIDVKEYKLRDLARKLGYVPCVSAEAFPMTVVDTVMIGRHPYNKWNQSKEDFEKVYDSLELMGIEDLAMRPFNELSAGQKQKVMLARGLVQETSAILLDEPTANLDIKHQYSVSKMLKRISRDHEVTVVMICHDLNIAAKYCDEIVLMSEGTVYACGTPGEVITSDNIKAVYGIDCRVVDDAGSPHVIVMDSDL